MALVATFQLPSALLAQTPVVTYGGENMRLASAVVAPAAGGSFDLTLQMDDDNGNGSLPNSWRRWWHCEVSNLPAAGVTLNFRVTNAGYSDVILPVWSLSSDGVTFGSYTRMPLSAVPNVIGSTQHRFTVQVPAGTVAIRAAKFFPYSIAQKDALLASVAGAPQVRSIVSLGKSQQGRAIEKIELTDSGVADAQKQRIWVHSAVHPAETTAYYMVEGLLAWLTSGEAEAEVLLDNALIEVVPMANPDGLVLGNYRTNANSVEIESQWSAPYNSTQPEIVALRTAIEGYMGTVANPASNPIRILLNLHSTHNRTFPFHFRHVSNAGWSPGCTSCGVLPVVHQAEQDWIDAFEARSPLVDLGTTSNSTLGSRPFVESMCHDRWTAQPGWMDVPNFEEPVMAITFEGTYGKGPDGVSWSTADDYRQVGREMGLALFDQLGLSITASTFSYGPSCDTATLSTTLTPQADGSHIADVSFTSSPGNLVAVLAVGSAAVFVPLPDPWAACRLLAVPDATVALTLDANGDFSLPLHIPVQSGLQAYLQAFAFDVSFEIDSSNGLSLSNDY